MSNVEEWLVMHAPQHVSPSWNTAQTSLGCAEEGSWREALSERATGTYQTTGD